MSERLAALDKVLELMGIDARVVEFRLGRVDILQPVCLKAPQLTPAEVQQGQVRLGIQF